ncbi:MAG: threonine--tRNA ligase [Candidatus Eutrophobiaceae bacterium]
MPTITLPDASERHYSNHPTVLDVAADIGSGLAKATLAGEVNGCLVDATYLIEEDARLRIITDRDSEGMEILRHSCAHLMAQAVKQLYPDAQVTIGPVIQDGFYYDYAYHRPFTPEDLQAIEERMKEIAAQDFPVSRQILPRSEAVRFFRDKGEEYKAQIIESIPEGESLSLYSQGDFTDLCRGPHVPSTGRLRAFKLLKLAAAYWRGDSRNESLQRIYGTAWPDKKQLKAHLSRLAEAEKRDHRRLGKKLDLFHFQEEAPGMVFWHPDGWTLYSVVEDHIRTVMRKGGYQEIRTPMIVDRSLWELSGHWDKFRNDMFTTQSENRDYAIKPMNCPCHVQVFNQGLKSYRDLPVRLAEFGSCHRNELSGALHGLMRARHFVQDDAHIFCTAEQVQSEVAQFLEMLYGLYKDFGFDDVLVKLSTRPENRVGDDDVWDKAEAALQQALDVSGLKWDLQPGEGAFYGPKIEFSLRDCLRRVWQCGTIQMDFSMPDRLNASYVDEHSQKRVPVMLHRAVVGSLERFIGILIEQYGGNFPAWLAPRQATILTITEKQVDYAREVEAFFQNQGLRVFSDLRNETIGLKIRESAMRKIPWLLIIGDREAGNGTVAVRNRQGEDLGSMSLGEFHKRLSEDIAHFGRTDKLMQGGLT